MPRYFIRCTDCLTVSALDGALPRMEDGRLADVACGCCDGRGTLESMGQVERDRLVQKHEQSPCDDRCTSARGPKCVCRCEGENHGAGMLASLVTVTTDKGPVPTLRNGSTFEARYHAAEYRRGIAAVRAEIQRLLSIKDHSPRGYLPHAEYCALQAAYRASRHATDARSHKNRMRLLAPYKTVAEATATPDEARAILQDLHALTSQDAQPLADVPYSLSAPVSTAKGRQQTLF